MNFLNKSFFFALMSIFVISCTEDPIDGVDGADGLDGADGTNGYNSLINLLEEAPGSNCANGGFFIEVGLDVNSNDVLDTDEVNMNTFICNGIDGNDGVDADQILVLTVNEPEGENCADGGVKLLIGYDSNQNGALDTEEVTSISFVCNGEDAVQDENVEGKTYVIFSGDISNEEAKAKIANEVGPNTQFIWVQNTTNLDSLELPGITELVGLNVVNGSLKYLNIPDLTTVFNQFQLNSDSLSIVKLNAFTRIDNFSNVNIQANNLDTVMLPSLELVHNQIVSLYAYDGNIGHIDIRNVEKGRIQIRSNTIESIVFSETLRCPDLTVFIEGKLVTESPIPFVELKQLSVRGGEFNSTLSNFEKGELIINNTEMVNLELSAYTGGNQFQVSGNDYLKSINVPKLDSAYRVYIDSNNILESISLDELKYVENALNFTTNNSLENLSFPSLNSIGNLDKVFLSSNSLNETSVNSILVTFDNLVSVGDFNGLYLTLNGSAPTGEGITAKESLITKGVQVYTD